MEEKERTIIIDKIGAIIKDASPKHIKVTNIEDFFNKILDCHDKIKRYPGYQTDREVELTLNRAKAGWDILFRCYNTLTRLISRKLSIDETEKQFSNEWIPFVAALAIKDFEYEKIRLPTIPEEQEILPTITTGSPPGSRTNSATTFREKEGSATNLKYPPIYRRQ